MKSDHSRPLTWVSGPDPETRDPALTGALRPETQPALELRETRDPARNGQKIAARSARSYVTVSVI